MNKIPEGGQLYEVGWSVKIPFTGYWVVWLKGIKVIEIVQRYLDGKGYYFNRVGHNYRS